MFYLPFLVKSACPHNPAPNKMGYEQLKFFQDFQSIFFLLKFTFLFFRSHVFLPSECFSYFKTLNTNEH